MAKDSEINVCMKCGKAELNKEAMFRHKCEPSPAKPEPEKCPDCNHVPHYAGSCPTINDFNVEGPDKFCKCLADKREPTPKSEVAGKCECFMDGDGLDDGNCKIHNHFYPRGSKAFNAGYAEGLARREKEVEKLKRWLNLLPPSIVRDWIGMEFDEFEKAVK